MVWETLENIRLEPFGLKPVTPAGVERHPRPSVILQTLESQGPKSLSISKFCSDDVCLMRSGRLRTSSPHVYPAHRPHAGVQHQGTPLHCQLDVCDCAVGQCSGRSTPQEDTVNLSKHLNRGRRCLQRRDEGVCTGSPVAAISKPAPHPPSLLARPPSHRPALLPSHPPSISVPLEMNTTAV